MVTKLPELITAKQFGEHMGVTSKSSIYDLIAQLPQNCIFRCGRRIRLIREPLQTWIESGGHGSGQQRVA